MDSESKIEVIKPKLPVGGGTIKGMGEQFAPHEFSGAASMSIPIPTTACRGMEPSLSLDYSSGNSNSPYGYGWDLSLSHIVRQTSKGVPKYDNTDTFLLAGDDYLVNKLDEKGNPIVFKALKIGSNTYTVNRYIPRVEGHFSLIDYFVNDEDSTDQFWKVTTASNTVMIFGKSKTAQIYDPTDSSKIFKWLPEEVYDDMGNHRVYHYQKENTDKLPVTKRNTQTQTYLSSIQYGNHTSITDGSLILNTSKIKLKDVTWHFEVVLDYGTYPILPSQLDNYTPKNKWSKRLDPFSTYDAGFEIRTWRLLQNVLLFHRFDELSKTTPILVNQLNLSHKSDTYYSKLTAAKHTGWQLQTNPKDSVYYDTKSLPPLTLGYTPFPPHEKEKNAVQNKFKILAEGDAWNYELTDLYSEGIPGLLYSDGESVFYRRVKSVTANHVTYQERASIAFPPSRIANGPLHTLADVTGNGKLDLVVKEPSQNGFYEMETSGSWNTFQAFDSFPSNFLNPHNQLQDLTGDGLSDLVLIDEENVRYNQSERAKGYATQTIVKRPNTMKRSDAVPVSYTSGKTKMVRFANFLGAGTAQRAEITNGQVKCWAGLGYGDFDEPITLSFPNLKEDFDTTRLFLTDIDGNGLTDIAYVYPDKIDIYLNQSGNGFDAIPLSITLPETWNPLDKIQFADVLGNGTSCLVFTKMTSNPKMYYYNFNYDTTTQLTQKPHLLNNIINNLGASSTITYASSVQYYLEDRETKNPWVTHLPFPVNVIASTSSKDEISGTTTIGTYKYSHGYYDGIEREFRGFGFVGRTDAPTFDVNIDENKTADEAAYNQAPLQTKTWYHTGAYLEESSLLAAYKKEYWQGGVKFHLPDTEHQYLKDSPDAFTQHGACRILHGTALRTEIYGNDQTPWAEIPYSVSEAQFKVIQLQEKGSNKYNVFRSESLQSISWDYERNAADPMVSHNCTLKTDEYGHVLESCTVHYGRKKSDETVVQTKNQQEKIWVSYSTNKLLNPGETKTSYLLGIPVEQQSFEIKNQTPNQAPYFAFSELKTKITKALTDAKYNELINWERDYYFDASTQQELPLESITIPVLHHRTEHIVFDEVLLKTQIPEIEYQHILTGDGSKTQNAKGGYITFNSGNLEDNYYWNPGAFQNYGNEASFYLPIAFFDPFQYTNINKESLATVPQSIYEYDVYHLLIKRVKDALDNTVSLSDFDYTEMQAKTSTDANNNWSKIITDPLGMVIATAHGGRQGNDDVSFNLDNYIIKTPTSDDIINNPTDYLQDAASFFYYNVNAWMDVKKKPAHSVHLNYTEYTSKVKPKDQTQIHKSISYSDGFGRTLQAKAYCDVPQEVRTLAKDGSIINKTLQECWLTSGAVIYNNKGHAIKQYEPFFAASYEYDDNSLLNTVGYSSTLFYDALGRNTLVQSAEGFFTKTLLGTLVTSEKATTYVGYFNRQLYGTLGQEKYNNGTSVTPSNYEFQPSAWSTLHYDANDCSEMKGYVLTEKPDIYVDVDKNSLDKAKVFANTPHISIVGSLGKTIETKQLNVSKVEQDINYTTYNVFGNSVTRIDQRLFGARENKKPDYINFTTIYNLGIPIQVISADAGTSWSFTNVVGHPIYHKDSRGFEQYSLYDSLQRPTDVLVLGGDLEQGKLNNTVKKIIYSDTKGKTASDLIAAQNANILGSAIIAFDEAGLHITPAHSIMGAALTSREYIRSEYKKEANWAGMTPTDIETLKTKNVNIFTFEALAKLKLPDAIHALMLADTFVTSASHNAIGQILSTTDADGNIQKPTYDSLGREQSLAITSGINAKTANNKGTTPGTISITYNAKGQQTKEVANNNVVTTHSYDAQNFRLTHIKSTRKEVNNSLTTLQDLSYHHDPVGNVCSVINGPKATPTQFFNGQQIEAKADYTFDALYQLIQATGREQAGMWSNTQNQQGKAYIPQKFAGQQSNGKALQNYTQTYSYDAGGNLLTQQQVGAITRTNKIAEGSNRLSKSGTGAADKLNSCTYDVHGNMQTLSGTVGVHWNYRDNMATATQIERPNGNNDTEYYIYNGAGQRVRKISEQLGANNSVNIVETLYAGGIEIRRSGTKTAWEKVWHNVKLMQGRAVSCLWRYQLATTKTTALVSQQRFQLTDALDSSNYEVDENAQLISYEEYYPYGGTSINTAINATEVANKYYQYNSKEKDKTGLYYYGMRYYAPWLGRWTCTDPAGTVDGLNVYAFVTGNPVSHVDVRGMGKGKATTTTTTEFLKKDNKNKKNGIEKNQKKNHRDLVKMIKATKSNVTRFQIKDSGEGKGKTSVYKILKLTAKGEDLALKKSKISNSKGFATHNYFDYIATEKPTINDVLKHIHTNRTWTRYSYTNKLSTGNQGPHIIARTFGVQARDKAIRSIGSTNISDKRKALALKELYNKHITTKDNIISQYKSKAYLDNYVKIRNAFNDNNASFVNIIAHGQSLVDLHPFATSFADASASDIKGKNEASYINTLVSAGNGKKTTKAEIDTAILGLIDFKPKYALNKEMQVKISNYINNTVDEYLQYLNVVKR